MPFTQGSPNCCSAIIAEGIDIFVLERSRKETAEGRLKKRRNRISAELQCQD